jgi:hypothetical protein
MTLTLDKLIEEVKNETEEVLLQPKIDHSAYLNNKAFSSPTFPKLQTSWDSHSIDAGTKCWRYYEYVILEGWSHGESNPHLTFGILFHKADEIYHKQMAAGSTHDEAVIIVVRFLLLATWDQTTNSPWISTEPTKSRKTLLRTVIWYLDKFKNQTLRTVILQNGDAAVETSFRIVLADLDENRATFTTPDGVEYILCGHIDRLADDGGDYWITDKKTTKYALDEYYFRQFSPHIQFTVYTIAGTIVFNIPVSGLIIDAVQVLVNGSRFERQQIYRTEGHLDEFLYDFQIFLREAENNARNNYYPLRRTSCGFGKASCTFRKVCSLDPSERQSYLETYFVRRQWDPMTPR